MASTHRKVWGITLSALLLRVEPLSALSPQKCVMASSDLMPHIRPLASVEAQSVAGPDARFVRAQTVKTVPTSRRTHHPPSSYGPSQKHDMKLGHKPHDID